MPTTFTDPMFAAVSKALVAGLPAAPALHLMRALAGRTQRPALNERQQQAMALATRLPYGPNGRNTAWCWGHDNGPVVLLVHGWNGRAAQLAPLALALSQRGYRCVAPDVTGHGDSAGTRTAWRCFIDDTATLSRRVGGELHACIGHSAGGLAMMGTRRIHGLRARRYVCICAPSHPFPPIRAIRQRLDPRPALVERYQEFIAGQFDTGWRELAAGHAFDGAGEDLLLFYDEGDRFVDHTEGDRIQGWCRGASLLKSANHGHTRVLVAPELEETIARFIAKPFAG